MLGILEFRVILGRMISVLSLEQSSMKPIDTGIKNLKIKKFFNVY